MDGDRWDFFAWARACRAAPLTAPQKAVLVLSLGTRAGETGEAWPSYETIAGDTGLARRTVAYAVKELQALEVLVRVRGGTRSRLYRLERDRVLSLCLDDVQRARDAVRMVSDAPEFEIELDAGQVIDLAAEVKKRKKPGSRDELKREIGRVWTAHRGYHPRSGKAATDGARRLIEARLRELNRDLESWEKSGTDAIDLIACYHLAPACSWFQGFNERSKAYLGISTLFKAKGWDDRIEQMREWRDEGRPVNDRLGTQDAEEAAGKAWTYLEALIAKGSRGVPWGDLEEKVGIEKAERFRDALQAVGGWASIGRARSFEVTEIRRQFVEAFVGAVVEAARLRGGA